MNLRLASSGHLISWDLHFVEFFWSNQINLEENKMLILGSIMQVLCSYSLYFWENINAIYGTMFVIGLSVIKGITIYILCTEIAPKKYQVYIGSFLLSLGTMTGSVPASLYLLLGGGNIQHILMLSLAFSVVSTAVWWIVPESPRYLYDRKLFKQLRKNLGLISWINGVKMEEGYRFENEEKEAMENNQPPIQGKF